MSNPIDKESAELLVQGLREALGGGPERPFKRARVENPTPNTMAELLESDTTWRWIADNIMERIESALLGLVSPVDVDTDTLAADLTATVMNHLELTDLTQYPSILKGEKSNE